MLADVLAKAFYVDSPFMWILPDEETRHARTRGGVDPAHQGQGAGGALLRSRLTRVDQEGAAAYLESSKTGNIRPAKGEASAG